MEERRSARPDNRGFSLVELMIVAVLGSLIIMSVYQVLVVNQQTYSAQNAQIQGQQTVRAAMDVLFAEFRELSTAGGDIVGMSEDTLRVRVMRTFGLVCDTASLQTQLTVVKMGSWFEQGDTVVVMADNDVSIATDDVWHQGVISVTPDTTVTCGSRDAQQITVPAVGFAAITDTIRDGAPIRSFLTYTYGLFTVDGARYLARRDTDGTLVPLVGPLSDSDTNKGLTFSYLKSNGATTSLTDSVAQIQVTLRTLSQVRNARGDLVADSVTVRIYSRN